MKNMTGTNRIQQCFANLNIADQVALITFITAGDPNVAISSEILKQLPHAGADIIELGMPFSDPMADGPSIQASSLRALKNGASLNKTLKMVKDFRKEDSKTPIILMGYFNPIYKYGTEKFITHAKQVGVDGLIIVDLPPEESEMHKPTKKAGLSLIHLIAPTTDERRLPMIIKKASGFLYYVSVTGVTGMKSAKTKHLQPAIGQIKELTDLPIAVGFGIKTSEQARKISKFADAVVVGSAFVNAISKNLNDDGTAKKECVESVLSLVKDIADGLKNSTD